MDVRTPEPSPAMHAAHRRGAKYVHHYAATIVPVHDLRPYSVVLQSWRRDGYTKDRAYDELVAALETGNVDALRRMECADTTA